MVRGRIMRARQRGTQRGKRERSFSRHPSRFQHCRCSPSPHSENCPPLTLTTPVARQDSLTHLSSHTRGLQIAPTHLPTPRSVTLPKAPFLQRHLPAPLSLTRNLRIHLHSPLPSLYFPLCPGLIISSFKTYAATFGEYKRS